jgi:CheY-like chemotaxis protein
LIGEDIEIILKPGIGTDDVRADKGQIEQVVMNLAINARDAMSGGGKLMLETSVATVDADFAAECLGVPPGQYVALAVTDTGVGMTPEVQARIFEPFFTTKKEGTGLGLSTTYGIVKQGGGCITVQSTPGFGTTFKVFLPAVESAAQESDTTRAIDSPTRGHETILLVEDQQEVRRLMREILGEHGYHTLEAAGGDDAISIARHYPAPIHLLITDIILPQMNGPEIVTRIRHIQPGVGVLMMSGYTADRLDGQLDDATPYLQKPFTSDELLRQVREILDLSRENASARVD